MGGCVGGSGRRKFAYVNIDLHSPSREDRPTVTRTLTKQVVGGGASTPCKRATHSCEGWVLAPAPRGPRWAGAVPLRLRAGHWPRGAARWSGCASVPGLRPAAADSRSSASGLRPGPRAPGTRHLGGSEKQAQSGPISLPACPPHQPQPSGSSLTDEVVGFADVIVPDRDVQGLLRQVAMFDVIEKLLDAAEKDR